MKPVQEKLQVTIEQMTLAVLRAWERGDYNSAAEILNAIDIALEDEQAAITEVTNNDNDD